MKRALVPMYRQKANSIHCGSVCLLMALKYFKIKTDFKDILTKVRYHKKRGTSIYELAIGAHKLGLKTLVLFTDFVNFSDEMFNLDKKELRKKIWLKWKKSKKMKKRLLYRSFFDYVSLNQKPCLKIIETSDIKSLLKNGYLVLSPVHIPTFRKSNRKNKSHIILLTGYDKDFFYYNDPYPRTKGKSKINFQHFLASLYKTNNCAILGVKK